MLRVIACGVRGESGPALAGGQVLHVAFGLQGITQEKWSKKEPTAAKGVENAPSASCSRNGGSSAPRHPISSNPQDSMTGTPSHPYTYVYEYIKQICTSMYILYIFTSNHPQNGSMKEENEATQ
mmetsp:Transcript_20695/g.30412  ORF Transcript_20695/g.30412 Transcript_20695/m.30412 type:complete len:124 (-) Transcript_20695:32-403(-)